MLTLDNWQYIVVIKYSIKPSLSKPSCLHLATEDYMLLLDDGLDPPPWLLTTTTSRVPLFIKAGTTEIWDGKGSPSAILISLHNRKMDLKSIPFQETKLEHVCEVEIAGTFIVITNSNLRIKFCKKIEICLHMGRKKEPFSMEFV